MTSNRPSPCSRHLASGIHPLRLQLSNNGLTWTLTKEKHSTSQWHLSVSTIHLTPSWQCSRSWCHTTQRDMNEISISANQCSAPIYPYIKPAWRIACSSNSLSMTCLEPTTSILLPISEKWETWSMTHNLPASCHSPFDILSTRLEANTRVPVLDWNRKEESDLAMRTIWKGNIISHNTKLIHREDGNYFMAIAT